MVKTWVLRHYKVELLLTIQGDIHSMEQKISSAKIKPDRATQNFDKIWAFDGSDEGEGFPLEEGRGRDSHYIIVLHWNFIVSLTGYCKRFHRIYLFPIILLFSLFCIYYWEWQGQKCKLMCPKVYEINSELYWNCNCCLDPFLCTNTVTKKPCKKTFVATENPYLI